MGIDQFFAFKVVEVCCKYNIKGDAYALGHQESSFSKEWANNIINQSKNGIFQFKNIKDVGLRCKLEDFFTLLGFSSYTDIDYNGKAKIILDFGKEIPHDFYNKANLLYDGGVIEHIPDIYQALSNIVCMVKKGGIVIHVVPSAIYGESYYSIDPMLLRDFYGLNGFETIEMFLLCWPHTISQKITNFIIQIIRPYVPNYLKEYHRKNLEKKKKIEESNNLVSQCSDIKIINNLFDKKIHNKFFYKGLPYGMHVVYIGIKRQEIEPFDIKAPIQGNYPSVL